MGTMVQPPVVGEVQVSDPRVGPPLTVTIDGTDYAIGRPPSVKQWAFIDRAEMEQLYGGSKSGGKSRAEVMKIILLAVLFPGNQLGMFRKDLTDLKGSLLVTFELMCPKALIIQHHRTDHYFWIRTTDPDHPSRVWYGGLGEEIDFESAKGKEYGAFAIDEPSEIGMQPYLQMLGQLRWVLPDGSRPPYQAILGSNPEPGWLEDHFGHLINAATEDTPVVTDGQRVYIMALPKDNPYLPPNWEAILRNQADIPQTWIDKYLGGSWKASEGLVFKELDEAVHYIETPPAAYLQTLTLVASLDHASTGVTCFAINGIDSSGNIIALGSYYAKNKLVSVHAQGIRSLLDYWVRACGKEQVAKQGSTSDPQTHWSVFGLEYILIDPSTQAKTQQSRNELISIQDMYQREGIPTVPAWNAIETGIQLMEEYIHVKPSHVHPFSRTIQGGPVFGSPSYFIVKSHNEDGVKEIERWKRTITINKTIKYVGADHWIDDQRYIIMSRPEPPKFLARDMGIIGTHDLKAQTAFERWNKSFGQKPDDNQWFGGGTNSAPSQWFPRVN